MDIFTKTVVHKIFITIIDFPLIDMFMKMFVYEIIRCYWLIINECIQERLYIKYSDVIVIPLMHTLICIVIHRMIK